YPLHAGGDDAQMNGTGRPAIPEGPREGHEALEAELQEARRVFVFGYAPEVRDAGDWAGLGEERPVVLRLAGAQLELAGSGAADTPPGPRHDDPAAGLRQPGREPLAEALGGEDQPPVVLHGGGRADRKGLPPERSPERRRHTIAGRGRGTLS